MSHFDRTLLTLIILVSSVLGLRELQHLVGLRSQHASITVYVSGEVLRPGNVTLPKGSRRIHALAACGGALEGVDLAQLAPAKHLEDGQTLVVQATKKNPCRSRPSTEPTPARTETSAGLDINRATSEELQLLPGIGPVLAERIIVARGHSREGTFRSLEDLTAIRGIKRKTLVRLTPYLDLEGL